MNFSMNIRHYLDEKGIIPDRLPASAKAMANYIGAIVSSVSSNPLEESVETGVQCHPTPEQKPCSGIIIGYMDLASNKIHWECPTCGNQGVIFDWEGTLWDRTDDQVEQAH